MPWTFAITFAATPVGRYCCCCGSPVERRRRPLDVCALPGGAGVPRAVCGECAAKWAPSLSELLDAAYSDDGPPPVRHVMRRLQGQVDGLRLVTEYVVEGGVGECRVEELPPDAVQVVGLSK